MAKILIVDDESDLQALIKQKFRQKIREQQYQFIFGTNGNEALLKIKENPGIDMVLSDINMPEMDGLTLLSKINELNPLIKTVIVSAYGDMKNIRLAMNLGAFDFITKPINFSDLAITVEKTLRHVEVIKETVRAIKENNILKMYVDETVINFMISREFEPSLLVSETLEATVVFIDICGFTALGEHAQAHKVVTLLNQYFEIMVKEIISQGGYIDKFIGDSIMAVFRGDYHLDRAIDAALALRIKINTLPEFPDSIAFVPQVSMGINSGEMISGNIGSASLRRLDYTVIGDIVNTAQRLQTVANENQIIITEASFLKVKESFNCVKIGPVKLKNKKEEIIIYEVLD